MGSGGVSMIGEPRRIAWQISLFYAALFVGPGIWLPFWSVWLESRGLGATEIAIVVSGGIWLRLVAGPVAAHLVDRSGARRRAIILLRSEEHTSELQSLMRISYAVFCLKKKKKNKLVQIL